MIMLILKIIGWIILTLFIISIMKKIANHFLYKYNTQYREYTDCENAKQTIRDAEEQKKLIEQRNQELLDSYMEHWKQVAQYYYYYYERGTLITDYAYMLDLLTKKIIELLGGDYVGFRNQVSDMIKGKEVKDSRTQIEDKGIPQTPKDIKPSDFEKRNYTDDDINRLLDEWQRKFKNQKDDNGKSEESK